MRILVIEHNKEIIESISVSLQLRWPDVDLLLASEGRKGIELVETKTPDVVILDLELPTIDSLDVLNEIRLFSDVLIIALSKGDDEWRRVRALEMGVDECIIKPFSPVEFLARVNALLRRTAIPELKDGRLPPVSGNDLVVNFATREVIVGGESVKLTPTEYNLLSYLVKNEGRVIPRRILMEEVWGAAYLDEPHLLKKYISRIRQKLNDDAENPQILIAERGVGYKFMRPRE